MANAYGLSPAGVRKAQDIVDRHRDQFQAQGRKIFSDVEAMQGGWVGQSATAFQALHRTWDEKQQTIVNILNQFRDGLASTEKNAVQAETDALDGVKKAERQLDAAANGNLHMRLGG